MEHLRARLPVPFLQSVLTYISNSLKKTDCREGQEKWVFPPMVSPHWNYPFCRRQARKGGLRKGVEGETSGGKTKRYTSPPVADEQPRRKLTRKRRSEEKREAAQVVSLFLCSPQVHFTRSSVHICLSQNYIGTQLFPNQSNLHQRQLILLNLPDFSRC